MITRTEALCPYSARCFVIRPSLICSLWTENRRAMCFVRELYVTVARNMLSACVVDKRWCAVEQSSCWRDELPLCSRGPSSGALLPWLIAPSPFGVRSWCWLSVVIVVSSTDVSLNQPVWYVCARDIFPSRYRKRCWAVVVWSFDDLLIARTN